MNALAKKMRFNPNHRNAILNSPANFGPLLGVRQDEGIFTDQVSGKYDWIIVFVANVAELQIQAPIVAASLSENGLLWFAFPKKSSKRKTDLSRDNGWNVLEQLGLRYISLISLDETWSAFGVTLGIGQHAETREKKSEARHEMLSEYINHATRVITLPDDLAAALKAAPSQQAQFDALSFTNRKEYVEWVISAKRAETRATRLAKTIEYLAAGRKNPADR
jgi:hypothetical protein